MFPKPTATHRGTPGSLSGSAGSIREHTDGNTVRYSASLVVLNADASDVQEYEYSYDGSTWTPASAATIDALSYVVGLRYRTRLSNSYFGTNTSYIASSAASDYDTGGLGAFTTTFGNQASSSGTAIEAIYNSGTGFFTLNVDNRPALTSETYFYSTVEITIPYLEFANFQQYIENMAFNVNSANFDFNARPNPTSWPYEITARWIIRYADADSTDQVILTRTCSVTVI